MLEEAWAPEYTYIGVIVDTDAIQKLQVSFLVSTVKYQYLYPWAARTHVGRSQVGHCQCEEAEDQTRCAYLSHLHGYRTNVVIQSITVIPRRNRLRIYIDGPDKFYRLRELKRLLPSVVVKVHALSKHTFSGRGC